MTTELASIIDFIRYAASRFAAAELTFGHSHDNPIDEATHLVLATLHLPPDLPPAYGAGVLVQSERALARIADGTYGVCESCGNPIGKLRLQVFPRATLCVTCKQRQERR